MDLEVSMKQSWFGKIIIQDQTKESIVEKIDSVFEQETAEGEKCLRKLFYLRIIRDSAETTKLQHLCVWLLKSN